MSAGRLREHALVDAVPTLSLAASPKALHAIIIDASRGERRLDSRRSQPASFTRIEGQGRVLDWMLHALRANDAAQITFVGGYHIQKVIEQYPELQYRFLAGWTERGEVEALRVAPGNWREEADVVIARATALCLPEAIAQLRGDEEAISLGLYDASPGRPAWSGLMHVPADRARDVFGAAEDVARANPVANLTDLVAALEGRGLPMRRVMVHQLAAPMNDDAAVAEIAFRGKARTLEQIAPLLKSAVVPESMRLTVRDWKRNAKAMVEAVRERFSDATVVVRSSAACEDALSASLAGRFRSVLNVQANDASALRTAVEQVIASYEADERSAHDDDEFIVQRQVQDLTTCGVVLTRDLSTDGPYFVVHVDQLNSVDAAPDRVTAGATRGAGVHYVLRNAEQPGLSTELACAVSLARELEKLTCRDALDIEFGITRTGEVNLLQVRPLTQPAHNVGIDDDLTLECAQIRAHVAEAMREHPLLVGETTVFSTMADWNPAEMIGPAPKPLALSLYQRLIGSESWSRSREALGYRMTWPVQLIHSLGGRPCVDVRASLNSLLPAALHDNVAEQLVNDGIAKLKADPSAHDKIEFEIAHSCATLNVERDRSRLREAGLDDRDVGRAHRAMAALTDAMIADSERGRACITTLEDLDATLQRLQCGRVESLQGHAARLQATLAACVTQGVTPFATLARCGFVALAMLRSLREMDVLSAEEHESIVTSIPTVASELDRDLSTWAQGAIDREEIVARYGHVRPSSYDVTSPSYASAWETYFSGVCRDAERTFPDVAIARGVLNRKSRVIEMLLRAADLHVSADTLTAFVIASIQHRELGKFMFMRAVHDMLECTASIGAMLGFDRDDVAMVPASMFEALAINAPSGAVEMEWGRVIEFNRKRWMLTSALRLPGVIREPNDVYAFEIEGARPTFVTQARISGRVIIGDDATMRELDAAAWRGAIVLLRAADPGYDWLFSKGIAGLVTAWGGAGSHMAIRAAEFGLPAAIGCGELKFEALARARTIELDAGVQTVRVLS